MLSHRAVVCSFLLLLFWSIARMFIIHFQLERPLGYFQYVVITNKAFVNIDTQALLRTWVSI